MKRITTNNKMNNNIMPDFVSGPLDVYRKKATFDWKKLKAFLETEDIIKYQNEIYAELQNHPDYKQRANLSSRTFDEERRIASREALAYKSIESLSLNHIFQNLKRQAASTRIMMQYAPASSIKYGVSNRLFTTSIISMGSERHEQYLNDIEEGKILGCYCLTEIGHGSNTRGMKTNATYNKEKKVFILNSPDFEAAKCWVGGLGQSSTHAIVYAQLLLKGTNHGLHTFVVPIRDPKTHLPFPGLVVGDLGEKIGLNGVDNGFIMFNNYEIPRENLLNKLGDVTEDGEYVTRFKDPNKRHGAALGALSGGRVNITCICETMGIKALTIAIRYAAVRKQFGPESQEVPILEYQTHRHRLLPYLSAAFVLRIFNDFLSPAHFQLAIDNMTGTGDRESLPDKGMEIHAISSASKPLAGWIMKEAIQECRETCGGHGYLKASGIGNIRNDHDANLTYEGENHVLIQQTSNWIIKFWPLVAQRQKISTPFQSVDFLSNGLDILSNNKFAARNIEEMCDPKNIISIYQWLVCYLLKKTNDKLENDLKCGKSQFWAKNDNQVYHAKELSVAYIQHFFLQRMLITISQAEDRGVKNVLTKLFSLYGLWSLEKHLPFLYQGEFANGPLAPELIQNSIIQLCSDLKDDAVSLIDAVAPPDFILQSVLGNADGMVYSHLKSSILSSSYGMNRPSWWQEILNWGTNSKL